jgi:hypothetical protein
VIPAQSAAIALSSYRASARPVAVSLQLHYEMQCGWPGPGTLTIRFPAGMTLPATIPPAAVEVDGKPASSAETQGRSEVLGLPKRPQIMCDVIGPGVVRIAFSRAARLGNPARAGTYAVRVTGRADSLAARFVVRAQV